MTEFRPRAIGLAGALVAAALAMAACGSAPTPSGSGGTGSGPNAATATSAKDLGGMTALVAAAKKEGQLNAITLPRDWANYGQMMDDFTAKYGIIKVNDENRSGNV